MEKEINLNEWIVQQMWLSIKKTDSLIIFDQENRWIVLWSCSDSTISPIAISDKDYQSLTIDLSMSLTLKKTWIWEQMRYFSLFLRFFKCDYWIKIKSSPKKEKIVCFYCLLIKLDVPPMKKFFLGILDL